MNFSQTVKINTKLIFGAVCYALNDKPSVVKQKFSKKIVLCISAFCHVANNFLLRLRFTNRTEASFATFCTLLFLFFHHNSIGRRRRFAGERRLRQMTETMLWHFYMQNVSSKGESKRYPSWDITTIYLEQRRHKLQKLSLKNTVFENYPKCRIWVFQFYHF